MASKGQKFLRYTEEEKLEILERYLNGESKGYKKNQIANKILTGLSNFMTGLKVTDMETCY